MSNQHCQFTSGRIQEMDSTVYHSTLDGIIYFKVEQTSAFNPSITPWVQEEHELTD